jgi:xanthine dehydrogenase YagR molybdenum-binding subunit
MGGGFGSKFNPDIWGVTAAELAKKAGAPVKLMLDRAEEHNSGGNRPSQFARVKLGCDAEGKLVAIDAESWGTGGHSRAAGGIPLPYVYNVPNRRRNHTDIFVNAGDNRAMRAPGHPQGALIMDAAMDDLCHKFDPRLDPVEFRLRNLPSAGPDKDTAKIWARQLSLGAARIGWRELWHPRGDTRPGPWKRGVGCALGRWGGGPGGAQASVVISSDGKVEVKVGTQDLGTGMTTLVPLVAAEILGLEPGQIDGLIGNSSYPPAGGSGGSTSSGGVSTAVAHGLPEGPRRALQAPRERARSQGGGHGGR